MAEITQTFTLASQPGIQRDGTEFDREFYTDGQWCRFQRGRPKKMGGYQMITNQLSGPIRDTRVWSRSSLNALYSFSPYGVEQVLIDDNGLGAAISDVSPSGWTVNDNVVWSTDTQYDDAVGSKGTVVLAHASSSLQNIDDETASKPYLALASSGAAFSSISDAPSVSGGIFSVAPYTFVHGSDGFIAWSDANLPQTWYTSGSNFGDSGADRVTGTKIVKGLPIRSGSGPAALLWSLDSVLRLDYTGGGAIFRFTHLSTQSSILSQKSVIEYDGAFFWMGVDRFLAADGGQVRELPNQMNINWVYDNLNYAQRQKVQAMKVPRYGEIWWLFPYGDATECTHAVIYNVREQTWYDTRVTRSCGFYSQVFKFPVMAASEPTTTEQAFSVSSVVGTFSVGDNLLGANGALGTLTYIDGTDYRVHVLNNIPFENGSVLDQTSSATATMSGMRGLYSAYVHEKGRDAIEGDGVSPVPSHFTTADIGVLTSGPQAAQPQGMNRWTRITRVEPDFLQEGGMSLEILGREFANSPETVGTSYNFTNQTERIDIRDQRREMRLKFSSNDVGGHYELGRVIMLMEPGDVRS